jgi:hypothetical protein
MCENRQFDQMIFCRSAFLFCFQRSVLVLTTRRLSFSSLVFCGKRVMRYISLCSTHKKKKNIYIYFCICKSYYFPLHWRRTFERREYTKTLDKKERKKREKEEYTWSEFFSFWLWKKEENTMTIMKIYFVRFYIAWDREKEREKYSDRKHMRRWIVVTSNTKTCTYIKVCL